MTTQHIPAQPTVTPNPRRYAAKSGEGASIPQDTVVKSDANPMAQMADLKQMAIANNAYGDNLGGSSTTERSSTLENDAWECLAVGLGCDGL